MTAIIKANIIICAFLILYHFCGTVSIASVAKAGHYAKVTRTPTENAYLSFSVTGFFLEIISTVCLSLYSYSSIETPYNIMLMVRDLILGIPLCGIAISCTLLEVSQRKNRYSTLTSSDIYLDNNYGAFAASAFFAFFNFGLYMVHFFATLIIILVRKKPCRKTRYKSDQNQSDQIQCNQSQSDQNQRNPNQTDYNKPIVNLLFNSKLSKQLINYVPPRHELARDSPEFKRIENDMINTLQDFHKNLKAYTSVKIIKIERLVNAGILNRYEQRKKELENINNGDANEHLFFHGSSAIEKIMATGFNINYANANGMFGKGIYFASDSSKSDQYTDNCQHPQPCKTCERSLLYCRVCLGKTKVEYDSARYDSAPIGYDSVSGLSGRGLRYPEYIVYRDDQAYAEYKITYKYT